MFIYKQLNSFLNEESRGITHEQLTSFLNEESRGFTHEQLTSFLNEKSRGFTHEQLTRFLNEDSSVYVRTITSVRYTDTDHPVSSLLLVVLLITE